MSSSDKTSAVSRRDFLRYAGFGAAALFAKGFAGWLPAPASRRSGISIELNAGQAQWPVFPGELTDVWRFSGRVISGNPAALEQIPGSHVGPTLRFRKGDVFECTFTNNLPEHTVVHWHGVNVPERSDGHPNYAIAPGDSYPYDYEIINRAGTYWYHPHPDMRTGPQVYKGLAGMIIVHDDEEEALALPRGEYDVPLLIQDKYVDNHNQFIYGTNPFLGTIGDRALVNGFPDYVLSAATRVYRLRIVNGSNARIYKLAWSDDTPLWVIGTDGGLMDKPHNKPFIILSPGERVELWADFSRHPVGAEITLKSLEIAGLQVGFGGGGGRPLNGSPIDIMRVRIDRQEKESLSLPKNLAPITKYSIYDAINRNDPRKIQISFEGMFLLNGAPFDPYEVAKNEIVQNGALEVWEFDNNTGNLATAHPIHLHGPQFQVLKRTVHYTRHMAWSLVKPGYTDEGWKDTVLLMPGERVQLLVKNGPYPGLYVYHCHNLEHEDMGMMRNFRVV